MNNLFVTTNEIGTNPKTTSGYEFDSLAPTSIVGKGAPIFQIYDSRTQRNSLKTSDSQK